MTRRRGPTRKERIASAVRLLEGLLRSPKPRAGLIAVVAPLGLSKNFVYGFLTEQIRTGAVTVLKTGDIPMYQLTEFIVIERPRGSGFPAWLEPREIPVCTHRHVYVDGHAVIHTKVRGTQC